MNLSTMRGIGCILIVHLCGAFVLAIIRVLSEDFHSYQLVFFYSALPLLLVLPWALIHKWSFRTTQFPVYMLRAVFEFGGFALSFYGLTLVTLPMHTALTFTVPLFATILAFLVLREKATMHAALSLMLGIIGVVIVTRPTMEGIGGGALYVLIAAFMFGVCSTCIKWLTSTDSPRKIMLYMYLLTSLITLPFALSEWNAIYAHHIPWIAAIALLSIAQQFFVAKALSLAPVTTIVPMQFSLLIFVSILGYALFDELIDIWTLLGAVCILGGTIYHVYHSSYRVRINTLPAESRESAL